MKRAQSVKYARQSRGIVSGRIHSSGKGPRFPVASNNTSEGKQAKRTSIITGTGVCTSEFYDLNIDAAKQFLDYKPTQTTQQAMQDFLAWREHK